MKIKLRKGREKSLLRKHPWIFSGAIQHLPSEIQIGDVIEVHDHNDKWLCNAIYEGGSLAAKVLSFERVKPDVSFWANRFESALNYRGSLNIFNSETNVYRLVHAESDGCPGITADVYHNTLVLQFHSQAINLQKDQIIEALSTLKKWDCIYEKPPSILKDKEGARPKLWHASIPENLIVKENGINFLIDAEQGQKTGFFIDQKENRQLLKQYANDKDVLNLFGYSGGFSVYAAKGGAKKSVTVDISKEASLLADKNAELNKLSNHLSVTANVFDYLKDLDKGEYDIMVLDPPAFAKSKKSSHNALQAYRRINELALKKVKPGGLIFTFSCSQVIQPVQFESMVLSAAINVNRKVKILHYLTQSHDHPIDLFFPESLYLKGLVVKVD